MSEAVNNTLIEDAVHQRAARRGLHVDIERMRYANGRLFDGVSKERGRTLYVGVGHGHDALLALVDQWASEVVGVDPYRGEHGNDDHDYNELLETLKKLGLSDRFTVIKKTVQDYLSSTAEKFDCIIFNDVLHHIYVTPALLRADAYFPQAVQLFQQLIEITADGGTLIIADVERHGLRPLLTKSGILKGEVDYSTKQAREEWAAAAIGGGWHQKAMANYIPWRFRNQTSLWSGSLGRWTICDKYFLWFDKPEN